MAYERLTNAIIQAESGGRANARNPRSSAGGAGQFIDGTWLAMIAKHRPDIAQGKSREQILQLKFDPALSAEMTAKYAEDNAGYLQSRGIPPTEGALSLAHFAGPSGAAAVYADPGASVLATLGKDAMKANPFLRGKTNADLIAWADRRVSKGGNPGGRAMAQNVAERYTAPPAMQQAVMSGGSGRQTLAGGSGADRLQAALYDAEKLARSENLISSGQDIAGRGDIAAAIGGPLLAGFGGYMRDKEKEGKKADEAQLIESLSAAGNVPPAIKALLASSQPEYKQAGIEALLKLQGPKPAPQTQTVKGMDQYGRPIERTVQWNPASGTWEDINGAPASSPSPATSSAAPMQQPQQPGPMAQPGAPQNPIQVGPGPRELAATGGAPQEALYGRQSVARGGKADAGAMPAPAAPAPQQAPTPQQLPSGIEAGPPAPKDMIGPGLAQNIGPDGSPLWQRTERGLEPVLVPDTLLSERGKLMAGDEQLPKIAQQFQGGIERLRNFPAEFGRESFERALGPFQAEDDTASGGGLWGTGLSLNGILQGGARLIAEAKQEIYGGAEPTEVRDRVNSTVKNIASVMKGMVRKPGEGVWTDKDQQNLEAQIGRLDRARSLEEYTRRINDIEENMQKVFLAPVKSTDAGTMSLNEAIGPNVSEIAKRPAGKTDNALLREALAQLQAGGDRTAIENQLKQWGVNF